MQEYLVLLLHGLSITKPIRLNIKPVIAVKIVLYLARNVILINFVEVWRAR